jgi:processive 1,2-diacylglycerol beta-glucosyltransferase
LRVLILCAEIGEGHVTVARALARQLGDRPEVEDVDLRTSLEVLGRLGRFLESGFHLHLEQIGWTYELAYQAFGRSRPGVWFGQRALAVLGGRGLLKAVAASEADVVVAEYPLFSAALGELRQRGRLNVPALSSISDPAGLHYWAHPGIDMHLLSWPESRNEVDLIAGPGRAMAVCPLVDPRFLNPMSREAARAATELDARGTVVIVSGGGWGLGDLRGATDVARECAPATRVVTICGRNERLRSELQQAWADDSRVRVVGFTEQMPELLAGADVLIHTTGGTTALESRVVGCRLINFGGAAAHVRAHHRALSERGLAEYARDRTALGPALNRALTAPLPGRLDLTSLPEAADVVVTIGRRRESISGP